MKLREHRSGGDKHTCVFWWHQCLKDFRWLSRQVFSWDSSLRGRHPPPSSLGSRLWAFLEPGQGGGGNLISYVIPCVQSRSRLAFHFARFPSLEQLWLSSSVVILDPFHDSAFFLLPSSLPALYFLSLAGQLPHPPITCPSSHIIFRFRESPGFMNESICVSVFHPHDYSGGSFGKER